MAFELYFSISRTAVELLCVCAVIGAGVYIAKDLIEEENKPQINPIEG